MAKTFRKEQLSVYLLQENTLQYATRTLPEGASQTFVAGAPVVVTSGLVVEAANPATAIAAFAMKAGQNTTGAFSKVVPVIDGVAFYANFLAAAGADNVLAAADVMGSGFDFGKGAYGADGSVIWVILDSAAAAAVKIVGLDTDQVVPNVQNNSYAEVGDTNARVSAIVLDSIRSFD